MHQIGKYFCGALLVTTIPHRDKHALQCQCSKPNPTDPKKKEKKATILMSNLPANGAFFQNPYHAFTYGL